MITIILITALASALAGFLLRGLLAAVLERKRRRYPLSMLSDTLLRGFADIADRYTTRAAGEAGQALLAELNRRHLPFLPNENLLREPADLDAMLTELRRRRNRAS